MISHRLNLFEIMVTTWPYFNIDSQADIHGINTHETTTGLSMNTVDETEHNT